MAIYRQFMKHLTTINIEIPGLTSNYKPFFSKTSLDDGDIVIFNPFTYHHGHDEAYQGKDNYNDSSSSQIKDYSDYWQKELSSYLENGGNVFVILKEYYSFFVKTGGHSYSGTGRNALRTNFVTEYDNYKFINIPDLKLTTTSGEKIKVVDTSFVSFFNTFQSFINYKNYINHPSIKPVFKTKNEREIVSGILKVGKGNIIFLPNINLDDTSLTEAKNGKSFWTKKALTVGKQFINFIIEIDSHIRNESVKSIKPDWLLNDKYTLQQETIIKKNISSNFNKIKRLNEENSKLNFKLEQETLIKDLLYETGKPLELAVNKALKILGYRAENYNDGKLELDSVIISPEGDRFIGECEGKDNKDIDITKFRQLNDSLAEDFARDEIDEKAFGLLFGNPQRLLDLPDRTLDFTIKCKTGATRENIGLIKTVDLFAVSKYILENNDEKFKLKCRESIKNQLGSLIIFPSIPENQKLPS